MSEGFSIVIGTCGDCGAVLRIDDAHVEDDGKMAIVEATCPNCGDVVIFLFNVSEPDNE